MLFLKLSARLCHEHELGPLQIEEMYSVPESFLEIEVRNPQTHGEPIQRDIGRFRLSGGIEAHMHRLQALEGRCIPIMR